MHGKITSIANQNGQSKVEDPPDPWRVASPFAADPQQVLFHPATWSLLLDRLWLLRSSPENRYGNHKDIPCVSHISLKQFWCLRNVGWNLCFNLLHFVWRVDMCISYVIAHVKVYKTIQIIYAFHMCIHINILYMSNIALLYLWVIMSLCWYFKAWQSGWAVACPAEASAGRPWWVHATCIYSAK